MPLTFPSHAAAILPLAHLRRRGSRLLPASALVLGSTAPDLIYLLRTEGAFAHRPIGLIGFCLPAGILAFLYFEGALLPVVGPLLIALLPARWQPVGSQLLGPRPLPRRLGAWLQVALALLLGAATHQLWDGFTHAWMWPARSLYPGVTVTVLGRAVLVSKALQHLSSILGLVLVMAYVGRFAATEQSETADPRGPSALLPATALRRLLRLCALPLVGAFLAAAVQVRHPHPLLTRAIWDTAWAAVAWFALLLGVVCLAVRGQSARGS